jgi:hypothetical protein
MYHRLLLLLLLWQQLQFICIPGYSDAVMRGLCGAFAHLLPSLLLLLLLLSATITAVQVHPRLP